MSKGKNIVMLIGNLGKDPTVNYTKGGTAVCNLRLAVTENIKVGDKYEDRTEWIDVVTFGKTAENCGKYLAKGRQVHVEGRITTREYDDKNGEKRWRTEVIARDVMFLGSKDGGGGRSSAPATRGSADAADAPVSPDFIDDDLPF